MKTTIKQKVEVEYPDGYYKDNINTQILIKGDRIYKVYASDKRVMLSSDDCLYDHDVPLYPSDENNFNAALEIFYERTNEAFLEEVEL